MIFKQINVTNETFIKIKLLAEFYNIKIYQLLENYILFFEENKDIINADFFQKSEINKKDKLRLRISNDLKKVMAIEINRVIGFLKVQDKFMNEFKRDVMFKFNDTGEEEYHPLFMEYDYVVSILKKLLEKNGILEDNILDKIEEQLGKEYLDYYKESEQKILSKKLFP